MDNIYPKVSIVLPTYNGARLLPRAVDSCLGQTYPDIELIIVDDGSTDETPRIIASRRDPRIKYIRHSKNKGLPCALNTGFDSAKGDYLTWTSDDNEYLPGAIEEMEVFLMENRDADFVYADYWSCDHHTGKKQLIRLPDLPVLQWKNQVGPCFLYTRRVLETTGKYNPKYRLVEDYDYWIRISKRFRMVHYPSPLYIYGEHGRSLTSTQSPAIILLDGILRYRHGYLSWRELGKSISAFASIIRTSPAGKQKKMPLLFSHLLRVFKLSPFMGVFSVLLLAGLTIRKAGRIGRKNLFLLLERGLAGSHLNRNLSTLRRCEGQKNVLWIIPYMVSGGSERVILNIARAMNAGKFAFHLVTTVPADHAWRENFNGYFQNIVIAARWATRGPTCFRYFCELIRKLSIDMVVISNSEAGYRYAPLLKRTFPHLKVMDILHSDEGWGIQSAFFETVPHLDRRICISNALKQILMRKYKEENIDETYYDRLKVIYNGIDMREYSPENTPKGLFKSFYGVPPETKIISFIGRLEEEKNPLLFVDIARNVIERCKGIDLRFVMAGNGSFFRKIKKESSKNGIDGRLLLTGEIDHPKELLADASILLLSSRSEGLPLVITEALAMGVPVVCTRVGAVDEVIEDNVTGYLIDIDGKIVDKFTEKILSILKTNGFSGIESQNRNPAFETKFSLETMGGQYLNLFEELLSLSCIGRERKDLDRV